MLLRIVGCALLLFTTATSLGAQVADATPQRPADCSASGSVLDQNGKPVAGATVILAGTVSRNAPRAITDAEGRFLLQGFSSGEWGLLAFKPEDSYPYLWSAFFLNAGEKFPVIDVTPGEVAKNVIIRLGPKAATINFEVTDEQGAPVAAHPSFTRPDMPETGDFSPSRPENGSMMVPAVPLRITVDADAAGYEPWHYGGAEWQTDAGLLNLKPGERIKLHIRLRRKPDASATNPQ